MIRSLLTALLFIMPSTSFSAGFLDHLNGVPYKWQFPLHYVVDQGNLGTVTGAQAAMLVKQAFDTWKNVNTATIDSTCNNGVLPCEGSLGVDVVLSNYKDYVTLDSSGAPRNVLGGPTVIIFDDDGSIFNDLFPGSSSSTLGLASPGRLDDTNMEITQGIALLNGASSIASSTTYLATMTHEFGHMLNLAHTQLNHEELYDSDPSNDNVIPTMYPILADDAVQTTILNPDDEFSAALLYPSALYSTLGTIRGQILRRTGEGVRAVVVICRDTADPRFSAVSYLSDQTLKGDGNYNCGGFSSGSYSVEIEPNFEAINIFDPDPPFIATESFSGADESFDPAIDDRTSSTAVAVTAGSETAGVDIVLNEDGRLISGEEALGNISDFNPQGSQADLEYFITVPAGASGVQFELRSTNTVDLDLFGRCDGEFSQAYITGTAAPLTAAAGEDQQSEFNSGGPTGNETISLTTSTTPAISACTYHLLVVNFDPGKPSGFTIKATVSGLDPTFHIRKGLVKTATDGSGDTSVWQRVLFAQDDTFRLRNLTYSDGGVGDMSRIVQAKLYVDTDSDGAVGGGDRLLASTTSIDVSARRISFTGFDEFFDPNSDQTYLLVYDLSGSSAGWSFAGVILAAGVLLGLVRNRAFGRSLCVLFLFCGLLSCGGTKGEFEPDIAKSSDVGVTGQTFGTHITTKIAGHATSVKDFFE